LKNKKQALFALLSGFGKKAILADQQSHQRSQVNAEGQASDKH
jgi:hypothetical protein